MKHINRFIVGISLTMFIATPNLFSQVLEEIVVTARKKEENLQDVAITVTAIQGDTLERLGIKDLSDITKMDPSLTYDKGFAPDDIRIAIRGIMNMRGRPVVANIFDGVDISSEAMATAGSSSLISPRMMDIERVEIVKGPQVALFGRTAFAGAIQYVTKDPSETFENVASLDIAQDGFHEARISSSGPISDTVGFRFNALAWDFDGFHQNSNTGANVGGGEGVGASLTFLIEPNDKLSIKTRLDYVIDEYDAPAQAKVNGNVIRPVPDAASRCNGGFVRDASCDGDAMWLEHVMGFTPAQAGLIPYASPWYPLMPAYPGGPMIPNATLAGYGSTGTNVDRNTGINYVGHFDDMEHRDYDGYFPDGDALTIAFDRNLAHGGYNAGRDMFGSTKEGSRAQANISYSGDTVDFNSWTHIANMDVSQQYDIDKEVLPWHLVELNVWGPTKLFSQELRLATKNDGPFNMSAGVLYWHEKMTQNSNNITGMAHGSNCFVRLTRDYFGNVVKVEDLGLSYFQGPCGYTDTDIAPHAAALGAARPVTPLERDINHASIYSVLDYDFSEKVTASLELRWTDEREKMSGPVYNGNGGVDSCAQNPYASCIDAPSAGPGSVTICGSGTRCDFVGMAFVKVPSTLPAGWRGYSPVPMTNETFRTGGQYISPKLTVSYQMADNILLFGSWAEARKPGGFSTLAVGAFSLDPNADGNPEEILFEEEVMEVTELGFKSVLRDGSLRVNGAIFFEDYTDRQVSVQKIIGNQLGNVIKNASGGEVFGAEIDMALAVNDKLTLSGGFTLLDSKYTDFKLSSTGAGEISRAGNCVITEIAGETTCVIDRTGNVFERAPNLAANINLNFTDELRDTGAMFFTELNARYQDDRAVDFDNNAWFKEYWRLDFRAGIEKGNWKGTLYVKNVLDDDTVVSGGNGPDIGNSDFRFGMVFTDCALFPGGEHVPGGGGVSGGCFVPGQNPNGKQFAPSVTAAPSIGNAWYASIPDPRQVGLRVTYSF